MSEQHHQQIFPEQDNTIDLDQIINGFQEILKDKRVIIGYTGGLGSTLLAKIAGQYCKEIKCVFVDARYTSPNDRISIESCMKSGEFSEFGAIQIIPRPDLNKDILILNPEDRDFFCKKGITDVLEEYRQKLEFDLVIDGTSFEKYQAFWGGKNKFGEKYVFVFGDAKLKEETLRSLAGKFGLKINRFSETDLLSRFSQNIAITPDLLNNISDSEQYIQKISSIPLVRLRVLDKDHLILEVKKEHISKILDEEIRKQAFEFLSKSGFQSISIDLAGYRRDNLRIKD